MTEEEAKYYLYEQGYVIVKDIVIIMHKPIEEENDKETKAIDLLCDLYDYSAVPIEDVEGELAYIEENK